VSGEVLVGAQAGQHVFGAARNEGHVLADAVGDLDHTRDHEIENRMKLNWSCPEIVVRSTRKAHDSNNNVAGAAGCEAE
jgi:hypothetical protein